MSLSHATLAKSWLTQTDNPSRSVVYLHMPRDKSHDMIYDKRMPVRWEHKKVWEPLYLVQVPLKVLHLSIGMRTLVR